MTGAWVRIQRGGKWENIEFENLTDEEIDTISATAPPGRGWMWAKFLATWIRENVSEEKITTDN